MVTLTARTAEELAAYEDGKAPHCHLPVKGKGLVKAECREDGKVWSIGPKSEPTGYTWKRILGRMAIFAPTT